MVKETLVNCEPKHHQGKTTKLPLPARRVRVKMVNSAYGRLWDSGAESGFHLWRIHPKRKKSSNIGGSGVCRSAKW